MIGSDYMRICFLAPINNYHTIKWCEYFISKGHEVHVISFTKGDIDNVNVHYIDCGVNVSDSDTKKIKYLFKYKKIKRLIKDINPDIVNAHYATSYGMIASLCNIDYILSIWGNDVYVFPKLKQAFPDNLFVRTIDSRIQVNKLHNQVVMRKRMPINMMTLDDTVGKPAGLMLLKLLSLFAVFCLFLLCICLFIGIFDQIFFETATARAPGPI